MEILFLDTEVWSKKWKYRSGKIELITLREAVEEAGNENPVWDGHKCKTKDMTWCNDLNERAHLQIISSPQQNSVINSKLDDVKTITCPSCGHTIQIQDQTGLHELPGLPAGVKFDPSDQEILEHLEAKVMTANTRKLHPLIHEFIPTIEGENGICYTHPEKLPGVGKDGQIRHFFHRPSKAYTTGTRKRRKVHTDTDGAGETRWHKTGKTRPVSTGGTIKGHKKILVLYTNYGRQRKPEKTNWVMHQYHLGNNEEEKDGELVVSKVFYQTQPRQCAGSSIIKDKKTSRQDSNIPFVKNKDFIEYYNNSTPFISYSVGSQISDNPPQIIPNFVVNGDGSSFFQVSSSASKGK